MNPYTGALYENMQAAIDAGELERDIVQITGGSKAVNRTAKAIQSDARRKTNRKAQRAARKRNR